MAPLMLTLLAQTALTGTAAIAAPVFDGKAFYRLTTEWQGDSKSLDIVNDGKNNQPTLAKTEDVSGQLWKITPIAGGFYRLTTQWLGDGKSLDIVNDGKNNQPVLAKTESVSGQSWKITKTK
ncbi:MAG: hypothetical protein CFE44_00910 [Burkholderiales bacterium PBB4]|nr:MAG: hypothetical protein CFE44_00910 [Burkholderiales bacterium PBB4]